MSRRQQLKRVRLSSEAIEERFNVARQAGSKQMLVVENLAAKPYTHYLVTVPPERDTRGEIEHINCTRGLKVICTFDTADELADQINRARIKLVGSPTLV